MHKYIFKRILGMIPVIFAVTFIVFTIITLSPGDVTQTILGTGATEEAREALREELGLNDPLLIQYGNYMINLVQGDMGSSYINGQSVSAEVFAKLPNTLALAVLAMVFASIIAIPLGVIAALKQNTFVDGFIMVFTLLAVSMPAFWFGLLMILAFAVELGILPSGGMRNGMFSYILPSITFGFTAMAAIARTTRSSMLEVVRQDYIRTARAKGVSNYNVIKNHALKNAMIPTITVIGIQIGAAVGSAALIEIVFSWPGLGRLIVDSITGQDTPMLMGCIIVFSTCFCIVNLIVDILYAYFDPRIKAKYLK